MITDGLDSHSPRWVRQHEQKEEPLRHAPPRPSKTIGVDATGQGGRTGVGLARASKLPSTAAVRTITDYDSRSGSDNEDDMITSESEGSRGRSSPHDVRMQRSVMSQRVGTGRYGSSEYSYSVDTVELERKWERKLRNGGLRTGVGRSVGDGECGEDEYDDHVDEEEEEEESSDSLGSSESSSMKTVGSGRLRNGGGGALGRGRMARVLKGCDDSGVALVPNVGNGGAKVRVSKGLHSRNLQKEELSDYDDDDIPSAPLFCGSSEIREGAEVEPGIRKAMGIPQSNETTKTIAATETKGVAGNKNSDQVERTTPGVENAISSGSNPTRLPTFHASALGPWHAFIAYDGCVRLCLNAWARGCMEAPMFLENECALLRDAFCVRNVLLQSEEELMEKPSSEAANKGIAPKPKKTVSKMKVQVGKVTNDLDPPTGCSLLPIRAPKIKLEMVWHHFSRFQLKPSTAWQAFRRIRVAPHLPASGSFSRQRSAYVHAGTRYLKQVSGLLKAGVTSLCNNSSSYEVVQDTYSCLLRLKSSKEEDAIRLQPGSGETHLFFTDGLGDELIVEVQDSKGKYYGHVLAQGATIAEDGVDNLSWWSIYREPEHKLVGKLQLCIDYSTIEEESDTKCGSVAKTVAYDLVLEVAMKAQHFQQRNLLLYGSWKWLLDEFASYYGVSDAYTKLRYLSYIMDVATPTADCLTLVYDLIMPVITKAHNKSKFGYQDNQLLGEIKDQIDEILDLLFENYKSLDESSFSGIMNVFKPATGVAASSLGPAVKLFTLLHDILSPEAQAHLTHHFQMAAKKRSRRHLTETDELVANNYESILLDPIAVSTAYQKMALLCTDIKNEVYTDIELHNQNILPSFLDLPNLSASIYSTELCDRLRAFLLACPPSGPSPPIAELLVATADFQKDLASWNLNLVKGGVDAKELFHLYIMLWIEDKRLALLESCELDKVKWSGVRTPHSTTPFIDEMYDRLKETIDDYEFIICRWPEYIFLLENAIADVEKAIVEALDKQCADVLEPLKENLAPKKFGFKYVAERFTKRSGSSYTVPDELGIMLNSMKRMLDILHPKLGSQFKAWGSCIVDGHAAPGDRLSEVTVMLRAKFRSYVQALVEKMAENTKLKNATKLKKILQESKESVGESDIRARMQPLKHQLTNTINHLQSVFETHVFIAICRVYWDRMGQEVLSFFENRKENRSWFKGSRIAVTVLDDTFASQMQQLLGSTLRQKDLEPPQSIVEIHSMLGKDAPNYKSNSFFY